MKTNLINLKRCTVIVLLAFSPLLMNAQGKLGDIKNKAKEKVGGGSSGTTTTTATGTAEDQQVEWSKKGDEAMSAKKYSEAVEYYQKAHDANPESNAAKRGDYISNRNKAQSYVDKEKENIESEKEGLRLLEQMKENEYKCSEIPTDNGTSGPFHDANVGKILFSKTEIVKGQEDAGAMTNSFTTSDNIYSRVYMAHSIGYECANMGICFGDPYHRTTYRFTVDGGKYDFSKSYFEKGTMTFNSVDEELMNKWTTWQPALSPASKDGYGTAEMQFFYSMLEFLPAGKHTIKLEIVIDVPEDQEENSYGTARKYTTKFGAEKVVASGEFTLEVKDADKAKVKTKTGAKSKAEKDSENEKAFMSTMENSGVWLINKCNKEVRVTAGGNAVYVGANSSTRLTLKAGDSIIDSNGATLRYFSSDPPAGRRTDVNVCN